MEAGEEVPESCFPPDVPEWVAWVEDAFWTLSTTRSLGFGAVGPIPWTAIDSYAERYGIAEDEISYDDFVYLIHAMDETFLEVSQKATPRPTAPGGS